MRAWDPFTRWGWWSIPASLVFWTLLWPIGVVWVVAHVLRGEGATREERRIFRLLRWYPAAWRERYGEEYAELLRASLRDGRGGPRLSWDVVREGCGERLRRRDGVQAALLLSLCWIPIFPQGLVALVMTVTGAPSRSWFLALYMPDSLQRPTALAMLLIGCLILDRGLRMSRRLAAARS